MKQMIKLILVSFLMLPTISIIPNNTENNTENNKDYSNGERNKHVCLIDLSFNVGAFSNEGSAIINDLKEYITQIVFRQDDNEGYFAAGYCLGTKDTVDSILNDLSKRILEHNQWLIEAISQDKPVNNSRLFLSEVYIETKDIATAYLCFDHISSFVSCASMTIIPYSKTDRADETKSMSYFNSSYHYMGADANLHWHKSDGTDQICVISPSSPHGGDGNRRRFDGYPWIPFYVKISFTLNISANKNRSRLDFIISGSNLANLKKDNNEALEMEISYYNSYHANEGNLRGYAFQKSQNATWLSNQPRSYLDTTLEDSYGSISLCVGCADTTLMSANSQYYWYIDSKKGPDSATYPQDGRFRVIAQRSYRIGTGYTAYYVFAEEHERQVYIGVPPGYAPDGAEYCWVPQPYNAYYCIASNNSYWIWNGSEYHIYDEDDS